MVNPSLFIRVENPHHFNANPINADPDLAPQQSDGNLRLIFYSTDPFGAYVPTL
jgi:hypothetical protein